MRWSKHSYQDGLTSERIETRFLTRNDIQEWVRFLEDERSTKYFPSFMTSEEPLVSSETWIEKQLLRYQEGRLGLQALIDRSSGQFIGHCGLLVQEIDGKEEVEVGYHIFPDYWGKGFATEAAKLFMDYSFKHNLSDSVISIIDRRNEASIRVAEKNGLFRDKAVNWKGLDVYVYRFLID